MYSKDRPEKSWWAAPDTIAFEKYYYSQPLPDGGQDNNRLEDFFSSIEDGWPQLVSKIEGRERCEGGLDQLLLFAIMHRVRVPTARDAAEKMLSESVRMTSRHLNDYGRLPEPPEGMTFDDLDQHMVVSIDPHRSIHAMADFAKAMNGVIQAVGFEILENRTDVGFITTDNPVIYFDPTISDVSVQPYNISRDRMDIEFMFPLTRRSMPPMAQQRHFEDAKSSEVIHCLLQDDSLVTKLSVETDRLLRPTEGEHDLVAIIRARVSASRLTFSNIGIAN